MHGGDNETLGDFCKFGIVTVSDRASAGRYKDISGLCILEFLHEGILSDWDCIYKLVPDEQNLIEEAIKDLVDNQKCSLVVTTGGTGPAPRDVTPEATEAVCTKILPGFGERMRAISLKHVPTAILSRQTAGVRGNALVMNLPGSPKSIRETIDEIFAAVPYCIDLIGGPYIETNDHTVKAYRPPNGRRHAKRRDSMCAER